VVARAELPVVAIAGIGLSNVAAVAETGARMAAVISALAGAVDPAGQARLLAAEFERGRGRRTLAPST
jgi:thiamine monophosphate synthase